MGSVLAIISKAQFEALAKTAGGKALGQLVPIDCYNSQHRALEPLQSGGSLFLVTVRPPDEALWLVAILEAPQADDTGWRAKANIVPLTDISVLKDSLRFENGKGITARTGALGMSLQTPRAYLPRHPVFHRRRPSRPDTPRAH